MKINKGDIFFKLNFQIKAVLRVLFVMRGCKNIFSFVQTIALAFMKRRNIFISHVIKTCFFFLCFLKFSPISNSIIIWLPIFCLDKISVFVKKKKIVQSTKRKKNATHHQHLQSTYSFGSLSFFLSLSHHAPLSAIGLDSVCTELIIVSLSWSTNTAVSVDWSLKENVAFKFVLISLAVPTLSYLDGLGNWS